VVNDSAEMLNEDELTAYHESGHTLLGYERYGRDLGVTVKRAGDDLGTTTARLRGFVINDQVRFALAGPMAEWFLSGRWNWHAAEHDHALVVEWQEQYSTFVGATEADRELNYCIADAARILAQNWAVVVALANELKPQGTLEDQQVREIIAEAQAGPKKAPPRCWSRPIQTQQLHHFIECKKKYREIAEEAGIREHVAMSLVSVKWMTPSLFARQQNVRRKIAAHLRANGSLHSLPKKLQKQWDGFNKARNEAISLRGAEELVGTEMAQWLYEALGKK
jgi:hypothetical protein